MDREEDGQGGASGKRARGKGVKGTGDAGATHAAEGLYHLCVAACSSSVFFFFFVYVVEGKRGAKLDTEQQCLRSAVCAGEGACVLSMSWGSHSISD